MSKAVPTAQVPGLYRQRMGETVVTTVSDGGSMSNPAMLQNITPAEAAAILDEAGRTPPLMTAVNAFVVQNGARTVLIDTGCGLGMGPTTGQLMGNLAAAGIAAGDIDTVLMTHLHGDHVGGLIDSDGHAAFPNASLLVPAAEAAFWLDDARAAAAPEGLRPVFDLTRRATSPYAGRMQAFTAAEPVPGIEAVPLPGHTPGHTGYMIGGADARLLIWGDIMHAPDIQSRRPEVGVVFDLDPATAIATRRAVLARAADERLLVAGMHMHFPAFCHVMRDGAAFAIRPVAWLPAL